MRVLVCRPDRLGDVVVSLPVVAYLRGALPGVRVTLWVAASHRELLEGAEGVEAVWSASSAGGGLTCLLDDVERVRAGGFDAALLLKPNTRLSWVTALAGVPVRIASGRKAHQWLSGARCVSRGGELDGRHEADYALDLARSLVGSATGEKAPAAVASPFPLVPDAAAAARVDPMLPARRAGKARVGLHPGHGGSSPNWTAERWAELSGAMADRGHGVAVFGGPDETGLAAEVASSAGPAASDLSGRLTVTELAAALASLDLLVASSTGPLHLAAAVGTRVVGIYCSHPAGSPERWGPLGRRDKALLMYEERCRACPLDLECRLEGIGVKRVLRTVEALLNERPAERTT
jgi:ADP-heptose:LPS heptosyltransferase